MLKLRHSWQKFCEVQYSIAIINKILSITNSAINPLKILSCSFVGVIKQYIAIWTSVKQFCNT